MHIKNRIDYFITSCIVANNIDMGNGVYFFFIYSTFLAGTSYSSIISLWGILFSSTYVVRAGYTLIIPASIDILLVKGKETTRDSWVAISRTLYPFCFNSSILFISASSRTHPAILFNSSAGTVLGSL